MKKMYKIRNFMFRSLVIVF